MMRRLVTVALMAALATVGFTRGASAGVTIDLVWRDTATPTLTVAPGDAGATCNVGVNNPAAAGRCLDIVMTVTNERLVIGGVSVQYDGSNGLAFSMGFQWFGVTFDQGGGKTAQFNPLGTRVSYSPAPGVISDFNGAIAPPAGPPSLPAGTYHLGTIVWNTSGASGVSVLNAFIQPGLDIFANGGLVDITSLATLNSAILTVIPEPGTASLLGLGLVGLIVAGRRRSRK